MVWNEEDENSSILKAISIAVETELETDDEATEEKDDEKILIGEKKDELKDEMTAGEHFFNIGVELNWLRQVK